MMQKKIIYLLIVIISSLYLGGCSTEAISFSQGFLEGYNEKMREDRYINNQIKILRELKKNN